MTDHRHEVRSEVGRLRTVLLHRPGDELRRLTPRNSDSLLFDGLPWVDQAQRDHDLFAQMLRDRGVEVLLLGDLLTETLEHSGAARIQGIAAAVSARDLRSQARFAAGQSPSSLGPSSEEEEAGPMFMLEVAAQKPPMGMRQWTSTSCRRPSPPWCRRTSGSTWRY